MIIKDSKLFVGGNKLKYWIGRRLAECSNNLVKSGRYKIVTNPTCKLFNPFTLIINFVVDSTEKYQLVLQGDYKKHYKESEDVSILTEDEMFSLIYQNKNSWFKKE
jgi:hypothetical protein